VLFFGSSLDLSFGVDHRLFSAAVFRAMIVEVSAAAIKSSCSQTGQSCLLYCSMLLQLKLLLLLLLLMSLKHVFFFVYFSKCLNASLEAVAKLFYAGKVVVVILVAFAKI
jgi:hypothetical protein